MCVYIRYLLHIYTATLLTIAKMWNWPWWPSLDEWVKNVVYLHNNIQCSCWKHMFLLFETHGLNWRSKSDTEGSIEYCIVYLEELKNNHTTKRSLYLNIEMWLLEAWKGRKAKRGLDKKKLRVWVWFIKCDTYTNMRY